MLSSISSMKENIEFTANGKLLLTGEYLVLAGAKALAFPVRFGQSMTILPCRKKSIRWTSFENGIPWFSCELDPWKLEIITSSDLKTASGLTDILLSAGRINPGFLSGTDGLKVAVKANYPVKWGLGSSSTLIALVAQWAGIDPFQLFTSVSDGSGYDIACATRKDPFFYRIRDRVPLVCDVFPGKAIRRNACFAYLGRKQETPPEVSSFLSSKNYEENEIIRVSELSEAICNSDDPSLFCSFIDEHEEILSRILDKERIQKRFAAFPGIVKSLGAWGGDFAMFAGRMKNDKIKNWLMKAGLEVVFTYDELQVIPF